LAVAALHSVRPWQTVWKRHDRWAADGTWDRLFTEVSADADAAGELDWVVSVDSSINRAHQHAAGARRVVTTEFDASTGGGIE
jgi:transposase